MKVHTMELLGHIPAKKNAKVPIVTESGKRRMIYSKDAQVELDRLALQIPAEVRDLNLEHPAIDFYPTVTTGASDRDNSQTTCLDLLVSYGVIRNDSVAACNGRMTMHTAERGDVARMVIKLTETTENLWPDNPRRKR